MKKGKIDVVLGASLGDEAKSKITDYIAHKYKYSARFSGSDNCGGEVNINGTKIVLHMIPAGIAQGNTCIIGNGCLVNPVNLVKEIKHLEEAGVEDVRGNLVISDRAFLTLPHHIELDIKSEEKLGKKAIGTTKKGVTPSAVSKIGRKGIRVGDIYGDLNILYDKFEEEIGFKVSQKDEEEFFEAVAFIFDYIRIENTVYMINNILNSGEDIICNGNQGTGLCIELGTTYPYCTSTATTIGAVCTGLGVSPDKIGRVYGVEKFYTTRVGNGYFIGKLDGTADGKFLQQRGHEFGSTTGRARSVSWLNLVALKYSCMINGITDLCLTKADVISGLNSFKAITAYSDIHGQTTSEVPYNLTEDYQPIYKTFKGWGNLNTCKTYEDFPNTLKDFLKFVSEYVGVPISIVSLGKDRKKTIRL